MVFLECRRQLSSQDKMALPNMLDFPFFTISCSILKLKSIESVILSNYLITSVTPFFCLQSFPALGSFPMSHLFVSGGQSIGASASATVLPMNIQGWLPLLTGLISLLSKGATTMAGGLELEQSVGDSVCWSHPASQLECRLPLLWAWKRISCICVF